MTKKAAELFTSTRFSVILFILACVISAFGLEFYGAILFLVIICTALCLCDDVMATTTPFLFACVFLSRCYNSYDTFIVLWPLLFPVAAVLIYHFVRFRKKIVIGKSFWGIAAVAAAVTLGGIGKISAQEYFSPMSLYYVGFLGAGMVIFYLLIRPQIVEKEYDVREKLAASMYLCGMLAAFVVLVSLFYETKDAIIKYGVTENYLSAIKIGISQMTSRANFCTFMMFALPFAFYRALSNKWHLLSAVSMLGAMFLTGSRAAMLLGTLEFAVCIVYGILHDKRRWYLYASCVALPAAVLLCIPSVAQAIFWRFRNGFIDPEDTRVKLIARALECFKSAPVFGTGLGWRGNTDLYNPLKGAMTWYHMMLPQIVGSLGAVGILAYLYQFITRVRLIFCKYSAWKWAMAISYLGILLMSQLNPGEFVPLPYEVMTVMLFMFMEFDKEKRLA